jgi:uncharacterized membrane protein
MDHQPFRNWLLSDEQLSTEHILSLQQHLASCESCSQIESAWKELDFQFQNSSQVAPAPGFTLRFQSRLVEYQSSQQLRRSWLAIAATAFIAVILLVLLVSQVWQLIQAPGPYMMVWLERLVSVISIYYLLQNVIGSISWSTPFVTFIVMFFLVGMVSFMSVLWLLAYKKFSLSWRVV